MWKDEPKDRDFFFNVVNTLYPNKIESMVLESVM